MPKIEGLFFLLTGKIIFLSFFKGLSKMKIKKKEKKKENETLF